MIAGGRSGGFGVRASRADRMRPGSIPVGAVMWLLITFLLATALVAAPAPTKVVAVESVGLTVGDLSRSVEFFTRVLEFERIDEREYSGDAFARLEGIPGARARVARLRLGEEVIELTGYTSPGGRPIPTDMRSNDHSFQHIAIIVSDMDEAYRRLREFRVRHISAGPQTLPDWNPSAGGIRAFYFMDPDGHPLEILQFPPSKGDPKWQRRDGRLFLGIDHTAIVVGETEASLGFYRDTLGMRVAGESENYGSEQEHLNAVFGARLRITSLRAGAGPGIEFLEYLAPSNGRPAPADLRADDLGHWQTRLLVEDAGRTIGAVSRAGGRIVSDGIVAWPGEPLGFSKAALARDPDGHALLLAEGSGLAARADGRADAGRAAP